MEVVNKHHEEFDSYDFEFGECDDIKEFNYYIDDHSSQQDDHSSQQKEDQDRKRSQQEDDHGSSSKESKNKVEAKEEEEFNVVQRYLVSKEYPLYYDKDQKRALRRKVKRYAQQCTLEWQYQCQCK